MTSRPLTGKPNYERISCYYQLRLYNDDKAKLLAVVHHFSAIFFFFVLVKYRFEVEP